MCFAEVATLRRSSPADPKHERGEYTSQGPTYLIEYDNTQNNANHSHTVWREFNGDWGQDLLKMHYESAHR